MSAKSDAPFSDRLRVLLGSAGISYRRAAEVCDLSAASVFQYAEGKTEPHRYVQAGMLRDLKREARRLARKP